MGVGEISGELERKELKIYGKYSNCGFSAERYRPGERDGNAGVWGRTPPKAALFTYVLFVSVNMKVFKVKWWRLPITTIYVVSLHNFDATFLFFSK
jgi:hypothetical protein